jgi:hypothetical protein
MGAQNKCRAGHAAVDFECVASMHWGSGFEYRGKLYVYLVGGRFIAFDGDYARALWDHFVQETADVLTGEYREAFSRA